MWVFKTFKRTNVIYAKYVNTWNVLDTIFRTCTFFKNAERI